MFNHEFLEVPYTMNQINLESGRHYELEGDERKRRYPSITSVLSAYSPEDFSSIPPRIRARAAERGTYMHELCEKYVLNELELPVKRSTDIRIAEAYNTGIDLFYQMKKILDSGIEAVYMSESKLKSDVYRIAGTIDLFARIKSKNIVLDYKSSTSRKDKESITGYFAQGSFYSLAIEESLGVKVDGVMILISTENEGVQSFYLDRNKNEHKPYETYLTKARKSFYMARGF